MFCYIRVTSGFKDFPNTLRVINFKQLSEINLVLKLSQESGKYCLIQSTDYKTFVRINQIAGIGMLLLEKYFPFCLEILFMLASLNIIFCKSRADFLVERMLRQTRRISDRISGKTFLKEIRTPKVCVALKISRSYCTFVNIKLK